jgi:pyruvate dehydrogenase E2 component (dihydrolipoamide acetyltransferase)
MALVPVYMPKYGMTMTEGVIKEWLKQEGETVAIGEPLLLVETEKVNTEIEAPASGTLAELCFALEDEAPVGAVVAYIETVE